MARRYKQWTRLFGVLIGVLGVAMVLSTIATGGGPLALGVIVGLGFIVLGAGRAYLAGDR